MEEGKTFGYHPGRDKWNQAGYKNSWWVGDLLVGITSSNDNRFVPHEFSDITEYTADAVEALKEEYDFNFTGELETSNNYHRYTNEGVFEGLEINPGETDDPSTIGLKITSGNDGRKATEGSYFEERQVCSNGLTLPVGQMSVRQTHHDELDPTMFHQLARSVVENSEMVEERYDQMKEIELDSEWVAFEFLEHRLDLPFYINGGHGDIAMTYNDVVEEPSSPTVYETLQVATEQLTHNSRNDLPRHVINTAQEKASQLVDLNGELPDYDEMVKNTIEDRAYQLRNIDDAEEYWEGEEETINELVEEYGLQA
ncbi:DUF945 domain-containing protein [Halobacteria archaeon AArc-curdl1]|uniref:DUF945 domain-containing protein n=1 Tax=Natronosalvus hydrolyticus TaxID=2979988 RepID=A0AAP2Z9Y6_9EURY|nr:DUF945 domain-containing protein [Halobacteria archaeon AArc-curdl1]